MAAPFQNYDGGTFLTDLVVRPEFLAYVQEEIFHRCKWIQSGVLVRNSALDCRDGGVRVQVPFFQPINPTEEVIESTSTWGTSGEGYLTPQNITADSQIMTIMHRGFAYAVDDLSKLGTGTDPMAAIRSYLAKAILKLRTTTLLNQVEGLFGSALDENIVSGALASGTPTDANFLTAAMVLEAKSRLGERGEELTAIAMHSGIYYSLVNTGLMTFSSNSLASGSNLEWGGGGVGVTNDDVAYFCGLRVIVDDMLAPAAAAAGAAAVYPVYLFGGGVVMEGNQQELRTESDRNILSKQDVMSLDYHYGMHVAGTSWLGTTKADNPENSDLVDATNWKCVYGATGTGNDGFGQKLIPLVKIECNSPYDLTLGV